jgi:hypothetical protein
LLHGVIFALARRFKIDLPQDLIRLVRKSRKSRRDDSRHNTSYRPPKNEVVNLSQVDLLELRKRRIACWVTRQSASRLRTGLVSRVILSGTISVTRSHLR